MGDPSYAAVLPAVGNSRKLLQEWSGPFEVNEFKNNAMLRVKEVYLRGQSHNDNSSDGSTVIKPAISQQSSMEMAQSGSGDSRTMIMYFLPSEEIILKLKPLREKELTDLKNDLQGSYK